MNAKLETLASDMSLATTAIMEARQGLFGIIKVNNLHDDRLGHLTEDLAYGGEQLCKVIGEKVEVLFAAISEIESLAEQKPITTQSEKSREKIDAINELNLKLGKLIAITDIASSDERIKRNI